MNECPPFITIIIISKKVIKWVEGRGEGKGSGGGGVFNVVD